MKTLNYIFVLAVLCAAAPASAQTDKAGTLRVLEARNYKFVATAAYPLNVNDINRIMNRMPGYSGGGSINLTGSNYDLTVTRDSITAYLPYYGRSYTPKIGGINDGGIKFKSKTFAYKAMARKKGGWNISIDPKDIKDSYSLGLQVTATGYATLTVNSSNQQTITFNGYIDEPETAKVKPK